MVQQKFRIGKGNIPQPFVTTLHMAILAGQRISAFPVDAWSPFQALEFTGLLIELDQPDENEERHPQWPEN